VTHFNKTPNQKINSGSQTNCCDQKKSRQDDWKRRKIDILDGCRPEPAFPSEARAKGGDQFASQVDVGGVFEQDGNALVECEK
jgi:hypothetical protein